MQEISMTALPFPLRWAVPPIDHTRTAAALSLTAGPLTDLFVDPAGSPSFDDAPRLLGTPDGDFAFSALVEVDFATDFDAGALAVYASPTVWAKLCFEFSPQREPMVVSVVNRGVSDDANGFVVEGSAVWLRVSRRGAAYTFHASLDGTRWAFVRNFALDADEPVQIGFLAQSPRGESCTVRFSQIGFSRVPPADLRDGS